MAKHSYTNNDGHTNADIMAAAESVSAEYFAKYYASLDGDIYAEGPKTEETQRSEDVAHKLYLINKQIAELGDLLTLLG